MRLKQQTNVITLALAAFAIGIVMPTAEARAEESWKEQWYMYRGRENKKINNNKAAIEAYEKAVEINPNNREASRDLGIAYENQGVADKAVSQYDSYLARWPDDREVALRQARLLKWSRYSYRDQDSAKYYKMALNKGDDAQVRLEYADTLASKKATSGQAIREYQSVLRRQPRNAAAHRGLAKAYAWNGDQDQALYHAQLARNYGDRSSEIRSLQNHLEADRGPEIQVEGLLLSQSSSQNFNLGGARGGVAGRFALSPFTTMKAKGGAEGFWNSDKSKSGAYVGAGVQHRFSPTTSIEGDFTYHGMSSDGFELSGHYNWLSGKDMREIGFKRELIYDSYLALVGDSVYGKQLGAARRHLFYFSYETDVESLSLRLTPMLGWVSASGVSPNMLAAADAEAELPVGDDLMNGLSLVGHTELATYQKDQSGFRDQNFEPYAGGYFSPRFFFNQELLARYRHTVSEDEKWSIEGGPSYQYVSSVSSTGSNFGGKLGASLLTSLSDDLYFKTQGEVRRVGDVYTQAQVMGWLIYRY